MNNPRRFSQGERAHTLGWLGVALVLAVSIAWMTIRWRAGSGGAEAVTLSTGDAAAEKAVEQTVENSAAASAASAVSGEAAKDQLKKSGEYESLAAAFHAARYAVEKLDPLGPHSRGADYFAANPAQQLRAWFRHDGIELASGRPTPEGVEPWSVQVRLRAVGRSGTMADAIPASTSGEGSRVEMAAADGSVTQWFENRKDGIEQGFTIANKPPGSSALEIALAIEGTLSAKSAIEPADNAVRFVDEKDAEVLHCSGLKAWDATGRELPARMEVRDAGIAFLVADEGAQYPVTVDPLFANVEARLIEDANNQNSFGSAIAADGDTLVVGASSTFGLGKAYVFIRVEAGWSLQATLVDPSDVISQGYGTAVALSGDTALIGDGAGTVYVYERNGENWREQAQLGAPDPDLSVDFGSAVALIGGTALVGDFGAEAAYIFTRDGLTWTHTATLTAGDSEEFAEFGAAVVLTATTAVIGAPEATIPDDDVFSSQSAGAVYVFTQNGSEWRQVSKLTPNVRREDARFGSSIAISGNTLLIGAPGEGLFEEDGGNAYVFSASAGKWR